MQLQKCNKIKVMYTNIDGIIPRKLELTDYLKEKNQEMVFLAETKLCEDIQTNIENYNYNIWIMMKSKIKVIDVEYGKGKTKLTSTQIKT